MDFPSVKLILKELKNIGIEVYSFEKYTQKEPELFALNSHTSKYVYNFKNEHFTGIKCVNVHYLERVVDDAYSILSNPGMSDEDFNNISQSRLDILITTYDEKICYYKSYKNIHLTGVADKSLNHFIRSIQSCSSKECLFYND